MRKFPVFLSAVAAAIVFTQPVFSDGPRHATGFTFEERSDHTVVTVTRPWQGATPGQARRYVLHDRGTPQPGGYDNALFVEVPIQSIVTMSTTFLPHLEKLGTLDTLSGHDALAWIYSPAVRALANAGKIVEVGSGTMVDVEVTLALDPDVIFANSYGGEWDAHPILERAGLPTVIAGDWVEETPLGRAEWIVFTGLFFDMKDEAEAIFSGIEQEYLALARLASSASRKPTVLINAPYQGTWSISGGGSYAARFIEDAGGDYLWSDDVNTGALFLDFETVFAEAGQADVWINPGAWASMADGRSEDTRFEDFKAFDNSRIYNFNNRVSASGGIDYFESGAANPHIVLRDLIWAFHPDLVPDYEPFYYQKLE